jgi:putative nucleotidyltransferase-like protein
MLPDNLLLRVFADPELASELGVQGWDLLLAQARMASLTARLSYRIEDATIVAALPPRVRTQFAAARAAAEGRRRALEWEVNRLHRVLTKAGYPMLLLKGAAYAMAGLPLARGRTSADIDIMVPGDRLDNVEQHLLEHGWELEEIEPYDARYYRRWSHELPPLRHRDRGSVLDVHHNILPPRSRLRPDPSAFWHSAVTLEDRSMAFCPTHMALHVAVHLFQDGEIAGGLGDLIDFDELCRYFGRQPGFWEQLVPAAVKLGLARPLLYALRYTSLLLGTTIPAAVIAEAERAGKPSAPVRAAMDPLVRRAIVPDLPEHRSPWQPVARFCLYVRSHWLRMPPLPLALHLLRKAWMRSSSATPAAP